MVRQKFIQFFDINTDTDGFKTFAITAGGDIVHQRLAPFFMAYKYYKLGKVKVKCVPASTLPVDPTGLSYDVDEPTVDPRDQFNPGLVRITNGENIDYQANWSMNRYYATMLDPRWYKFRLQSGFQRTAKPLVWNLANNMQVHQPGNLVELQGDLHAAQKIHRAAQESGMSSNGIENVPVRAADVVMSGIANYLEKGNDDSIHYSEHIGDLPYVYADNYDGSGKGLTGGLYIKSSDVAGGSGGSGGLQAVGGDLLAYQLQNRRERLGWMPTDVGGMGATNVRIENGVVITGSNAGYAQVPEIDLITFVLPKAFKTKYYYRVFIETEVFFKDPVVIDPFTGVLGGVQLPVDRFGKPERLKDVNLTPHTYWTPENEEEEE